MNDDGCPSLLLIIIIIIPYSGDDDDDSSSSSSQYMPPSSSTRFGSLRERLLRLSDLYRVAKTFNMSGNGDFDSETVYGKPVQVISIDENENTFSLNEENLNLVLSRIPAKMKLSVVSVVGAFRTGKSFLLDFFLKYLRYPQNKMGEEAWNNLFTSKTKLMVIPTSTRTPTTIYIPTTSMKKRVTMASPGKVVQKEIRSVYGSGACPSFASLSPQGNLLRFCL